MRNLCKIKRKILILLDGGIRITFAYSHRRKWQITQSVLRELENVELEIDDQALNKNINQLCQTKLLEKKKNSDGTITIFLTEKGKKKAITYNLDKIEIEKKNWDGKWRIVVFDIPERKRKGRDALRDKIKKIGFLELQKSVWVCPYDCKDQIDYIVEFFDLRQYVRLIIAEHIDNESYLKNKFNLK